MTARGQIECPECCGLGHFRESDGSKLQCLNCPNCKGEGVVPRPTEKDLRWRLEKYIEKHHGIADEMTNKEIDAMNALQEILDSTDR